ncbi:MAG: polyphenol oxidase family protein [Candidatus Peregrinibacteria bacterium]|nr:polyphenol oxidase family protein [Candidatus Peregrinibacteria bacterium]
MHFLKFKIFEKFSDVIRHGLSTRNGGVSGDEAGKEYLASLNLGQFEEDSKENLEENYKRFCEAVGVKTEELVRANQVHKDDILILKGEVDRGNYGMNKPQGDYDGFITNVNGLALSVRFADCQGVLFFDPVRRVIAAVHAGWRGNVKNIIGKCVRKMVEEFGCSPENIFVGISQSLGPCHAEFSEPEKELPEWMQKYLGGEDGRHVDLWQCSFDQLVAEEVPSENIEIMRRCTVCENDIFFSSRAGKGKMGVMGGVICLK